MEDYYKIAKQQGDYILTALCKGDLEDKFTKAEIDSLDDNDMEYIATKITEAYLDNGYWDNLQIITKSVLEDKRGNK